MAAPAWAMPSGPKLLIGVLHKGIVSTDWARMYYSLQRPGGETVYSYSSHWPYDVSRNSICETALQYNVEWLFFLDSDVVPPDDAILRLMSHNLPIVSGVYWSKVPPHLPLVLRRMPQRQPDGTVKQVLSNLTEWTPGEVLQVDGVPTGCLLIHRRVLQRFKEEGLLWFEWTIGRKTRLRDELRLEEADVDALDALGKGLPPQDPAYLPLRNVLDRVKHEPEPEGLSEDFDFSARAKSLGFPLHVDTSVFCAHVTDARLVGPPMGSTAQIQWMETP